MKSRLAMRPGHKAVATPSPLESRLLASLKLARVPAPTREYKFHTTRRWRFDFAWPAVKVAMECEGATWSDGRHTTGAGFEADCIKYAEAAIAGWCVLRVTRQQIESGQATQWAIRALSRKERE